MLLLGGTAEARVLARRILETWPDARLILSLAGRTLAPDAVPGALMRIGGFGGAAGLAAFLRETRVARLVDATHPFAAGMSRNAAAAAARAGVPRLSLWRPPWDPVAGDDWTPVACLKGAVEALPPGARPFLALGHQHLAPFFRRADLRPIVRMIDPPDPPLPAAARLVLGRPFPDPAQEAALLAETGATHLVCRNSGGAISYAKIAAARALALPVVLIERPPPPAPPLAASPAEALVWLGALKAP
ncbi:cobalt-precorrin-6X reductase [Aurantimonas sp. Leaf443]|nr:cobalt-precorrin-6X reductase [Aurantimonas sp. Leaf443]